MGTTKTYGLGGGVAGTTELDANLDGAVLIEDSAGADFFEIDTANERLLLAGGGAKVGIGTDTPDTALHVVDSDGDHVTVSGNAEGDTVGYKFASNGSDVRAQITSNGNTGLMQIRCGVTGNGHKLQFLTGGVNDTGARL